MRREHAVPLILWLGAALWLHVLLGRGGNVVLEGVEAVRDAVGV